MIIALIPTGTLAAESTAFAMQDFGIWGESWFGAHNVGWKYSEDFDTASLTGLEVMIGSCRYASRCNSIGIWSATDTARTVMCNLKYA